MGKYQKALKGAQKRLALGRAAAVKKAPYASDTLYGLVPHFLDAPVPGIVMAVTKKMVLIADPVWVMEEPAFEDGSAKGLEVVAGCLFHETCHVQRGFERLEALKDKELAGIAADLAINCVNRRAGWLLPPWVLYPEKYGLPEFKTLEWYYAELLKLGKGKVKKAVGDFHGVGSGSCGSCSFETTSNAVIEEIDAAVGRLPVDVERIRYQTAEKTKAARTGGFGNAPGFFEEVLDFKRESPVIPWNRTFSRVSRRAFGGLIAGDDDLSYHRPSKRGMALGVLRPGTISHKLVICVIVDASASMGEEELNTAGNQIIDIMKQQGIDEVLYVCADTAIHKSIRPIRITEIPRLKVHGRGGTDFRSVLGQIVKARIKPDVIVYMTDGDGPAPKAKPKGIGELIWCVIPGPYIRKPANWGHFVLCSNDPADRARLGAPYEID